MPTIAAQTPKLPPLSGAEEFIINDAGADKKITVDTLLDNLDTGLAAEILNRAAADTTLTTNSMPYAGGAFTGVVTVLAPIGAMEPTTLTYVNAQLALKANLAAPTFAATADGTTAAVTTTSSTAKLCTTQEAADSTYELTTLRKTIVNVASITLTAADMGTILIDATSHTVCDITLPNLATLTDKERYQFNIVDSGKNSETLNINLIVPGGTTIDGGAGPYIISTDGASVELASDGVTNNYIVLDQDAEATETISGIITRATTVEAATLAAVTKAVTPPGLSAAFDASIYKSEEAAVTPFAASEDSNIIWNTVVGARSVTLPDPAGATIPLNQIKITINDNAVPGAGTNPISVQPLGTAIIRGYAGNLDITTDGMGVTLILNTLGTEWIPIFNSQLAATTTPATPWTETGGVNVYYGVATPGLGTAIIGDSTTALGVLTIDRAAGDDSDIIFSRTATPLFAIGVDDTNDAFTISAGSSLGTTDALKIGDTNQHWAMGPIAIDATVAYTIQNTTDAPATIMEWTDASGVNNVHDIREDGCTYSKNCVAVGNTSPTPNTVGVYVEANYFHTGFRSAPSSVGNDLYGYRAAVTAVNAADDNIGIELTVQNGLNNIAIDISQGNMRFGTGTGTKIGTAITEKLGFWNVTPVVQPFTFGETTGHAAVGGTNVDASDTFTGNTGATAYTINDIVKHLKTIGVLLT